MGSLIRFSKQGEKKKKKKKVKRITGRESPLTMHAATDCTVIRYRELYSYSLCDVIAGLALRCRKEHVLYFSSSAVSWRRLISLKICPRCVLPPLNAPPPPLPFDSLLMSFAISVPFNP